MNVFFILKSANRYILSVGFAGVLLSLCQPARANETDDEIQRLSSQAEEQAAAHAAGDVAETIDEVSRLVPHASSEGVAAVTKLMGDLDRMMRDAQHAAAETESAPEPAAPPPAPQAAPAPVAAPSPVSAPAAGLIELLRRRGDAAFRAGDISGARRYYQSGAENGSGACAEAMAKTYDARELLRIHAFGVAPDPALAETWRNRARQLSQNSAPQ